MRTTDINATTMKRRQENVMTKVDNKKTGAETKVNIY
jgi:hypothetical protein